MNEGEGQGVGIAALRDRPAGLLIAGCGYVGSELARQLLATNPKPLNGGGAEVSAPRIWGLRRDVSKLPPGVEPVAADLTDPAGLAAALPDEPLDAVVYALSAGSSGVEDYRAAYVEGLRHLLALLEEREQRPRLLYVSSTGVYGQQDGSLVDERSPTEPRRAAARELVAGELLARERAGETVVVRFSGIYGPGRTRLIEQVRGGRARRTRAPVWTNRIHRDDCAGVLAHLLRLPDPAPIYVGSDEEPAERNTVYAWLAGQLGVGEPPLEDQAARGSGRIIGANKRCDGSLLRGSGYAFRYPTFREGYAALLAERRVGAAPAQPSSSE